MKRKLAMVLLATTLMTTSVFATNEVSSTQIEAETTQGYTSTDVDLLTSIWTPIYTVTSDDVNPVIINAYANQYDEEQGTVQVKVTKGNGSDGEVVEEVNKLEPGQGIAIPTPTTEGGIYTVSVRPLYSSGNYKFLSDLNTIN